MPAAIWRSIYETLKAELKEGVYPAGSKLPTESILSQRFKVNRHTLRRALGALEEEGILSARRGSGVFVTSKPRAYRLGRRVRFHQSLSVQLHATKREMLSLGSRPCTKKEGQMLALSAGKTVLAYECVSYVEDVPLSWSSSVFPITGLENLEAALHLHASVTKALGQCGIEDYIRAHTSIVAQTANAHLAAMLHIPVGAPILRSTAVNHDMHGRPIEYGVTQFSGDRVSFDFSSQDALT